MNIKGQHKYLICQQASMGEDSPREHNYTCDTLGHPYLGPLSNRIQIHPPVDQSCCQLSPSRLQSICAQSHRSGNLTGFNEFHGLSWSKQAKNAIQHKGIVSKISLEIFFQLSQEFTQLLDHSDRKFWIHSNPNETYAQLLKSPTTRTTQRSFRYFCDHSNNIS